jgi:hypothetical protein
MMRSGQYATSRRDADTRAGYQELGPPVHDERYGLSDIGVCVQGVLTAVIYSQARRVVEGSPHGFEDVYSGFEELWGIMAWR